MRGNVNRPGEYRQIHDKARLPSLVTAGKVRFAGIRFTAADTLPSGIYRL